MDWLAWFLPVPQYRIKCIECGKEKWSDGQYVEDFYFCNAQCAKAYDVRVLQALKRNR